MTPKETPERNPVDEDVKVESWPEVHLTRSEISSQVMTHMDNLTERYVPECQVAELEAALESAALSLETASDELFSADWNAGDSGLNAEGAAERARAALKGEGK